MGQTLQFTHRQSCFLFEPKLLLSVGKVRNYSILFSYITFEFRQCIELLHLFHCSDPNDADQCDQFEDAFIEVVEKLIIDDMDVKIKVLEDMCLYKNKSGYFGAPHALKMAETQEPLEWWGLFGNKTSELKKLARRMVGLCCSTSSCERN